MMHKIKKIYNFKEDHVLELDDGSLIRCPFITALENIKKSGQEKFFVRTWKSKSVLRDTEIEKIELVHIDNLDSKAGDGYYQNYMKRVKIEKADLVEELMDERF